jgi:hypothetical protein
MGFTSPPIPVSHTIRDDASLCVCVSVCLYVYVWVFTAMGVFMSPLVSLPLLTLVCLSVCVLVCLCLDHSLVQCTVAAH